jgi:HEAT repeat protein
MIGVRLAGVIRYARRVHRGQLALSGGLYVDHLERVAAVVSAAGGGQIEVMAAWLHGVGQLGVLSQDLLPMGVPLRVVRLVETLTRRAGELPAQRLDRVRGCPAAVRVLRADLLDGVRSEALADLSPQQRRYRIHQTRNALSALGLPISDVPLEADDDQGTSLREPLTALTAENPDRWRAAAQLASVGDPRAAQPLVSAYLAAVRGDPGWADGANALIQALYRIVNHRRHLQDPAWVRLLEHLAHHPDPRLRQLALTGLRGSAAHQPLIMQALEDPDPRVVTTAVITLELVSISEAFETMLDLLISERLSDQPGLTQQIAGRLAATRDPRVWPALLTAAEAGRFVLPRHVARAFAAHADRALTPKLLALVDSATNPFTRDGAVFVLGEWRVSEAAPAIGATLEGGVSESWHAWTSMEALTKIGWGGPWTQILVGQALHNTQPALRVLALQALARTGDQAATHAALQATDDVHPEVRAQAVRTLAAVGDQTAVPRLLAACDGPHAAQALRGLLQLADARAIPTLTHLLQTTTDRRIRRLAGQALVHACNSKMPAGLYLPGWSSIQAQRATAWVLGRIGDPAAVPRLTAALVCPDELLRARAAAALGNLRAPDAAEPLRRALADPAPRVRANAATALSRIRPQEAHNWLQPHLDDPHPDVRHATAAALHRIATR